MVHTPRASNRTCSLGLGGTPPSAASLGDVGPPDPWRALLGRKELRHCCAPALTAAMGGTDGDADPRPLTAKPGQNIAAISFNRNK